MREWLQHAQVLNEFSWIALDKTPEWEDIDKTARKLIDQGFFKLENHQKLFHVQTFLRAYMTETKIAEYKEMKTPIAERWVDFFKNAKDKINCEPLIQIVAYILAIPGIFPDYFCSYFQYS